MSEIGQQEGTSGAQPAVARRTRIALALLSLLAVGAWPQARIDARGLLASLRDPLSIFAARSPGERQAGALTQTKPGGRRLSLPATHTRPTERVLSGERTRAAPINDAAITSPGGIIADQPPVTDGPFVAGNPGSVAAIAPTGETGGGGGGGTFFSTPIATGPGVGSLEPGVVGGGGPTAAVPEPQTWAMLITGLFVVGGALRRRRASRGQRGATNIAAIPQD